MSHPDNALDRRQFLQLALMSSAMLMASTRGLNAEEMAAKPRSYAVLQELAPGAVEPSGWLRVYLEKQAAELGSQLPNVSWPFTENFWDGADAAQSNLGANEKNSYFDHWWPWEQKAYWIDGATRLSIVLDDKQLMEQVQKSIDYTLSHADTPINSHGVTYAEIVKLPAILYIHTGKPEYLRYALAGQRRIFDHHMLIDGIPSTSEWYRTTTALDSHETCDISDHTWSWGYMMMATGDGAWGDHIERACFNAGPGAIKNDWKALQYFSCPNQFLATLDSNHNVAEHGGYMMAYQPNPGKETACCGGNVHRLMPNYVVRMWMQDQQGGLWATLYGPSRVKARVGAHREPVEIVQTTNYPFEEQIRFEIQAEHAVKFPLSLRIPTWCSDPQVAVNGSPVRAQVGKNGFVTLDRKFKHGDTVTLTVPMKLAVSKWPENGIGIEHGPLVYSLAIKENWEPVVEPKYTTAEFPSWQATPTSAWNYGLVLDPGEALERQVQVERVAVSGDPGLQDPWNSPPITLTVPARKVEGWSLLASPEKPEQKFTPALPDLSQSRVSDAVERITLVPYGSTQLRVTIFPELKRT